METNQRIDLLYKEYARLNDKVEDHIKNVYEDFKFLGAIGAIIVLWKPISDLVPLTDVKIEYDGLLFLGFLSLLLTWGLILFLNLTKQAYMFLLVHNLRSYEEEIRRELHEQECSQVFNLNLGKEQNYINNIYPLTVGSLGAIVAFTITCIPIIILFNFSIQYAIFYLIISLTINVSYYVVLRKVIKQYFRKAKFF